MSPEQETSDNSKLGFMYVNGWFEIINFYLYIICDSSKCPEQNWRSSSKLRVKRLSGRFWSVLHRIFPLQIVLSQGVSVRARPLYFSIISNVRF
jgi:hypothetical protein